MTEPLVSILTPVYNAEDFLEETIQSVLKQSHQNFEFIIINDGSTDKTENVILTFSDQRIKYISQKNAGVSNARNNGLKLASGDFICFLDGDDILPIHSIQSRVEKFKENDSIYFVDGVVQYFNENPSIKTRTYTPTFYGNPYRKLLNMSSACFMGQTWMIRNENIDISFMEGLTNGEDLLCYLNLSKNQDRLYNYTTEDVLYYRVGNGSSATSNIEGLEKGYLQIITYLKLHHQLLDATLTKFRLKALKRVFLSFVKTKKYSAAFRSIGKFLVV